VGANAERSVDLIETVSRLGRPGLIVNREGRVTWQNDAGRELFAVKAQAGRWTLYEARAR